MTNSSTSSRERLLAFVPQWEYQLCDDPLEAGAVRERTLTPMGADSTLSSPLANPVSHVLEHHVPDGEERHMRARITQRWEGRWCLVEPEPREMRPVADHDDFTAIRTMKAWDDDWQPSSGTVGIPSI